MSEQQLKIAQMNTKAVTAKLVEYETRHAEQEKRCARMEARLAELEKRMSQLQAMISLPGSGPTA